MGSISKEATIILDIIKKQGVMYNLEYIFDDCVGRNGMHYRFDFALFDDKNNLSCLIEYDSKLHFDKYNKLVKNYKDYRYRDEKKNVYCLAHNIPLYRISYWDLKDIKEYEDLFRDKYRVKTRWHNYNVADAHNML